MSQDYAWPSSSQLEFEARRMHATPGAGGLGDLAPALVLRGLPQVFDFFAVAIAAVIVLPKVFFADLSPVAALAAGAGVLALAPAARWLPLPVFDLVRRRHGRGVSLTAARVLLGTATAAIAFLPAAGPASWPAIILLVACRLTQGLAAKGVAGPRIEPPLVKRRDRAVRWAIDALTIVIGMTAAGALFVVMTGALTVSDFLQWGWRYPFVAAIALNLVGLFADLRLLTASSAGSQAIRLVTVDGVTVSTTD